MEENSNQSRELLVIYFWDDNINKMNGWGQMLYALNGKLNLSALNDITFAIIKDFKERNCQEITPIIVNIITLEK